MPCYRSLEGFVSRKVNPTGKRSVVFNVKDGYADRPVVLPCGQCVGCRLERSRQWAIRCIHEASLYDRNCFLTLTYNDSHLPFDGHLVERDVQLFLKRFRRRFGKLRYFYCGEYGDQFSRPHYHMCVFGFDFPDKEYFKKASDGESNLYISKSLFDLWVGADGISLGHHMIGDVTFESAAYVARYVMKKITGKEADEHYVDKITGALRPSEYVRMSRRPGIGRGWIDMYQSDVYPSDEVILRGLQLRPPRYYDSVFDIECPDIMRRLKVRRRKRALLHVEDSTPERLLVREEIKIKQISMLKRSV